MSKKSLNRFVCTAVIFAVVGVAAVAAVYVGFFGKALDNEVTVRIGTKTTYDEIVAQIRPSLRTPIHRLAFDLYAKRLNLEKRYETGNFSFGGDVGVIRIVRNIVLGEQIPVKLVVSTARTLPHLAKKLAKQIDADTTALLAAMRDDKLRKEFGFDKDSTIAMFIPNTYQVYWDITPEELLRRMHKEYKRFWNSERTAKLERCGMSKYEVMTMASIVYEETKAREEMATVAGVYVNRLRKNMRLQADPTVKYAMGDFALRRILRKHLKYESPFNTYLNAGLPPAPICIPSIAAIDAVLNFEEHEYIYFCARPEFDGRHNFARTLDEHNANARKYAEALNKRGVK
ncbi:MAG: endolytic transglycosylase MltG [Alistipes sp.]|nr:endolytic transglycosylase MltG [Alistipes sp.]